MDNNKENKNKGFVKGLVCGAVIATVVFAGSSALFDGEIFGNYDFTVSKKASSLAKTLEKNYIMDFSEEHLDDKMFAAMADSMGDPYTQYFNKEEMTEFMESSSGELLGIGVVIGLDKENGKCMVHGVIEDSPAFKAGIQEGDAIVKVNDMDVIGMDTTELTKHIKGKEGTSVKVTVERPEIGNIDFDIVREVIQLQYVYSDTDGELGYIKISQFAKPASEQFKTALDELMKQNIKGLIIDLRNNPGGIVDTVTEIADAVLPEGLITYTVDKYGNREDFYSKGEGIDIPIAVLVNENSASASELFTGAVMGNDAGTVIGTQTFGKGIVQGMFKFPDDSGIKITIQKYYTPDDICIQGVGITPDIIIESDDISTTESDIQYNKAVEILNDKIKD